ncbi:MAG: hypothetical protein IPK31_15550 [Chitinophagaceae bacterium]|nr:hypothetical protein [Chitinophagaceae bacterium]
MKAKCTLILLFSALLFLSLKCKKDNTKAEPQLPPETTTGAMTFGCKIDGEVFIPKDGGGLSGLKTEYLFLGNGPGGGWFLNIAAVDRSSNVLPRVAITTDSLLLVEGNTYQLVKQKGFAKGQYGLDLFLYQILSSDQGELFITKHNQSLRILSGRFSFTASTFAGEKVTITEGRFDIRY